MPVKSDTTPQKYTRGKPSTPSTPQPGQKILTGLSMGQKYHDDPDTLEKQFRHLEQFKPAMIKPFLSGVAHVHTDLLPKLIASKSLESWQQNLHENVNESILSLYRREQEWREAMQPIFDGKQSGYDEGLVSSEYSSDVDSEASSKSESPATSQESQFSQDAEEMDGVDKSSSIKKIKHSRERANSDMDALTSVDNWLVFDEDIRLLLNSAAEERGITVHNINDIAMSLDFDSVDTRATTLTDSEITDEYVSIPFSKSQFVIKQNAYFKSIFLNMHVYYIQGRLLLIDEDIKNGFIFEHSDIVTSLNDDLRDTLQKIEIHNIYMQSREIRNPFHFSAFSGKKADNKLAKLIASELLRDAENYLAQHFKDKILISRHGDSYKCIYALKYSIEYMIKNFSVIGMYSIFYKFDMYHYPRKTTDALITFTNKFLNPIIKTLVNIDPNVPFSPMDYRDTSSVLIAPYITTPIEIKEEFLADVSKTIKFLKEEWEKGGRPEDMLQVLNDFKPEELSQISSVLLYWIDFTMTDFKKLSRRSILHLKDGGQELQHDPQFEEALKNAKIVMKMLISCMRYSLPEEDYRFTKMISLYKKALRLFTLVLSSLNCDFSTDKLNVIVDEEVISRMRVFLGKIQDEKLALSDAYQILGEEFKDSQISELDQKINDTCFLINKFGHVKTHTPYESEDDSKEPNSHTGRSVSPFEKERTPSKEMLLIGDASMYEAKGEEVDNASPKNAESSTGKAL
ncbi:MAG: hypothetical protein P8L77_06025 [Gammaproteobacteria bacterium]|nr:hypothetical protein [Gammaproteobacteria bacterium]